MGCRSVTSFSRAVLWWFGGGARPATRAGAVERHQPALDQLLPLGFNGLCRFNRKGEFNVPFGKFKTINYERDWSAYAAQFSQWDFTLGDFGSVQLQPGDFVYADPPYDVEFTTYAAGGFTWSDQVRAAEWLAEHDGPVVLVNQATERIEELYRSLGFDVLYLDAPRRISCTGDRTPAREVFATRNVGSVF